MAKKGIGGVITGSIILFLGAIIITAGVGGRMAANTFLIEPMVAETFQTVQDEAIPMLEPQIKDMAYPMFLDGVYTQMQYAFDDDPANLAIFINGSTAAGAIYGTANALYPSPPGPYADLNAALVGLFNDNIQTLYSTPIPGISEAMNGGSSLGYTLPQVGAVCMGTGTSSWMGIPWAGILEEDPLGDMTPGILVFMQQYQIGLANASYMADMVAAYGLVAQPFLDAIMGYISNVLFPAVPLLITGNLGWDMTDPLPAATASTVGDYILAQWAQKALLPDGLGTLDPAATNFEVDTVFQNLTQVKMVWGSLLTEFSRWRTGEAALEDEFNLTSSTFTDIINWIPVVEPTVLTAVAGEYGLTYTTPSDLYLRLFVGQWQEIGYLLPYSLFEELGLNVTFELDLTAANQLSNDGALALWTELKTKEGIMKWYGAVDKRYGEDYLELKAEHGLVDEQMNMICNYLEDWRDVRLLELNIEQQQMALPIWGYDIGKALNDLELYLPIAGGVFACAGVLLIALFARKRA
jgi:hypothetical protein